MRPTDESPIAVIGIACRYPPRCTTPEEFWRFIESGGDAIVHAPRGRWDRELPASRGGFLQSPSPTAFDARFFGIAPREAGTLDPQQRMLLETAWEALEDAAIPPDRLRGSSTGVYVGIGTADHQATSIWRGLDGLDFFTATGASFSAAAGRIAYCFGFEGPAVAVDTACSSGLVALHLACQALRDGDCDLALVGGVNALLAPHLFVCLRKLGLLSADGRCKSFDAAADGYVRSEGCGVLVLKRAGAARADGNRIYAFVRGTAVNQDGRSTSLTSPSAAAQEKLLLRALDRARLTPGDIDYVEAHGTGTPLGDVVEARALAAVFGATDCDRPLVVGSVKTNIGHLEAGAGIAGTIKTILALRHETIPAHLHLQRRNPEIHWNDAAIALPAAPLPWPRGERTRRAGVSSFGFSGTNAHVILEEGPPDEPRADDDGGDYALILSAQTPAALRSLAQRYIDFLEPRSGGQAILPVRTGRIACPPLSRRDISYTAAHGRTRFAHTVTVSGDWIAALRRFVESGQAPECAAAPAASGRSVTLPLYPFQHDAAPPATRDDGEALLSLALGSASTSGRERFIAALNELARTLLVDDSPLPLDDDLPLVEQGFGSLLALELCERLEQTLAIAVPPTVLFNYPTLRRLAGFLHDRLSPAPESDGDSGPAPGIDLSLFDGMSERELRELIDRELRES